ncbi:LCP family protein [Actinoplanes sp. NPDC051851]|uniref:LCP family protein n=1 Tax=Actinoplanes sp. NPDC051851 TaxID=3154753 RepID=UPI00341F4113
MAHWKRLVLALGCCLLLIPAGAVQASVQKALGGPLNLLLVGIDPRDDHTAPLADSIIVAHIPADRRTVYLFSIPRDLVTWIPAFPRAGSAGQRSKINAAMALGSRIGNRRYDPAQGFRLLSRTVRKVTGITRFDGGAVIDFGGFKRLITAMGGVDMVIDQDVVSEHHKPDGTSRDRLPACPGHDDCHRPYIGPQKTYRKSDTPQHLSGWEALDYARQRYGLPHVDYDRQRHQRQMLKALATRMSSAVAAEPGRLPEIVRQVEQTMTFVGGGHTMLDWATFLAVLNARDITSISLHGMPLFEGGAYRGEQLDRRSTAFFAAVVQDRVPSYLQSRPGLLPDSR